MLDTMFGVLHCNNIFEAFLIISFMFKFGLFSVCYFQNFIRDHVADRRSQIYRTRDKVARVHHLLVERGRNAEARAKVFYHWTTEQDYCDMAAK